MTAKHRPNPVTNETTYRVYRLTDALREKVKEKKIETNLKLQDLLNCAIDQELPKLVGLLSGLGLRKTDDKKRPARLPMTDSMLGALKVASVQTGIPATQLLLACLTGLTADVASPKATGAKRKATKGTRKPAAKRSK